MSYLIYSEKLSEFSPHKMFIYGISSYHNSFDNRFLLEQFFRAFTKSKSHSSVYLFYFYTDFYKRQ